GVHEVVDGVATGCCRLDAVAFVDVDPGHLDRVTPRSAVELPRRPGAADHLVAAFEQFGDQPPADVARGPDHQHPHRVRLSSSLATTVFCAGSVAWPDPR